MQMKSIARRPFKYAGMLVAPQAEFSVKSERDAKVLAATRRAALVVAPVQQVLVPAPAAPASKRAYKRRDMVAETAAAPASPMAQVPHVETDDAGDMRLLMHVRPAGIAPAAWTAPGPAPAFDAALVDMLPPASADGPL